MNLPHSIESFIDESPVSLVAEKGGPLSLKEIHEFYNREVLPLVKNKKYGQLCLAGLMFAQDYIWEGHEIVQDYPDLEASWWHAFMHRMEGDYGNASYWYRRVGDPVEYSEFYKLLSELSLEGEVCVIQDSSVWDPFEFNGLIDRYRASSESALMQVHLLEFKYLFGLCFRKLS